MSRINKVIAFCILFLTSIALVSCGGSSVNDKITYRLKENSDSTKSLQSTRNTSADKTYQNLSKKEERKWYLGDTPEIYFEYEREESFVFLEASIVRSSEPTKAFKFSEATTNLDGYKIESGRTQNLETGVESFRAIITVPDIVSFDSEDFILDSIKILVNNKVVVVSIPVDLSSVNVVVDEEGMWKVAKYHLETRKLIYFTYPDYTIELKLGELEQYSINYKVKVKDTKKAKLKSKNVIQLLRMGDSIIDLEFEVEINGKKVIFENTINFNDKIYQYDQFVLKNVPYFDTSRRTVHNQEYKDDEGIIAYKEYIIAAFQIKQKYYNTDEVIDLRYTFDGKPVEILKVYDESYEYIEPAGSINIRLDNLTQAEIELQLRSNNYNIHTSVYFKDFETIFEKVFIHTNDSGVPTYQMIGGVITLFIA